MVTIVTHIINTPTKQEYNLRIHGNDMSNILDIGTQWHVRCKESRCPIYWTLTMYLSRHTTSFPTVSHTVSNKPQLQELFFQIFIFIKILNIFSLFRKDAMHSIYDTDCFNTFWKTKHHAFINIIDLSLWWTLRCITRDVYISPTRITFNCIYEQSHAQ